MTEWHGPTAWWAPKILNPVISEKLGEGIKEMLEEGTYNRELLIDLIKKGWFK